MANYAPHGRNSMEADASPMEPDDARNNRREAGSRSRELADKLVGGRAAWPMIKDRDG